MTTVRNTLEEEPARVAGQGVLDGPDGAHEPAVGRLHRAAERGGIGEGAPGLPLELAVGFVEVDEDLERQRLPHRPRVLARLPERVEDRIAVVGLDGEAEEGGGGERGERAGSRLPLGEAGEDRAQVTPLPAGQVLVEAQHLGGELLADQEQAGGVLGALEVAAHPVEAVGDPGEDHGSRGARARKSGRPP
jgi:hypothetical protein